MLSNEIASSQRFDAPPQKRGGAWGWVTEYLKKALNLVAHPTPQKAKPGRLATPSAHPPLARLHARARPRPHRRLQPRQWPSQHHPQGSCFRWPNRHCRALALLAVTDVWTIFGAGIFASAYTGYRYYTKVFDTWFVGPAGNRRFCGLGGPGGRKTPSKM